MPEVLDFKAAQAARDATFSPDKINNSAVEVEDDNGDDAGTLIQGPAKCLACKNEWIEVAGCGDTAFDLVCPKCDTRRGQFIYPIEELPEDTIHWVCGCGSSMFQLVYTDEQGYFAKSSDDLAAINTSGGKTHTPKMYCVGCGEAQNF